MGMVGQDAAERQRARDVVPREHRRERPIGRPVPDSRTSTKQMLDQMMLSAV
jgi:hypothetical protein